MRFIHTSDWHIGRQFHGQSLLDDQRHVLEQLLNHVTEHAVDAVVIAGDIYDRAVPPAAAVALLDQVLHRLCVELGVPVVLIPGNHDSAARIGFGASRLQQAGLHIIADFDAMLRPVTIAGVDFFGIPYNDPEQVRSHYGCSVQGHDAAHRYLLQQLAEQAPASPGPRVLLSHCFIDGAEASESERPLSIGGADRVSFEPFLDYDYVALGHLHSPQYRGAEQIRYSGSILKYSFSEQHQRKGVTLVELNEDGLATRLLPLQPQRDMRILEGELAALVEAGRSDPHADDYLLVRLTDRQALLDPMGKLREVYPNVLHLEKPGLMAASEAGQEARARREQLKRGELELFRDFFSQVVGQPMNDAQEQALQQTLHRLHRQQEGER